LNTTASSVPNGVGRFFPDVNTAVNVSASGNLDLTDYGTVIGNFLPYGFLGMAVGRASYSVNTASLVQQTSNNVTQTFLFTNGAGQTNARRTWTPNILVRGEFEFVQFAPISNIAVSVASGRVGAGFKF
jgi:opacity protein-like surface antigen